MGVLDTTYTFTATDIVTSTKLNNVLDQAVFTSSAIVSGNTTLAISSGALKVNSLGITSNELATDSVTTAKILDANVTTAKILDANITQAKLAANVVGKGPIFLAFKTDTQSIPDNVYTQITGINVESFDSNGDYSTSTSTFTASVAGYYLLMAALTTGTVSNNFHATIFVDGVLAIQGEQVSSTALRVIASGIRYLAIGAVVILRANTSTALTVTSAEFSGCLIRSA
jgi:hypothetical protein